MRKKLPHLLTYFFLLAFIVQIACLLALFLLPAPTHAEEVLFTPQVSVGKFQQNQSYAGDGSTRLIAEYVMQIYQYSIGIVGILAAVVLMVGGVMWLTSAGNTERVTSAKAWISASLSGLVLALMSYAILNTIDPDLVNFKPTVIQRPVDLDSKPDASIELVKSYCENKADYAPCGGVAGQYCFNGSCIVNPCVGKNFRDPCVIDGQEGTCSSDGGICLTWSEICEEMQDGDPCGDNKEKICLQGKCIDPVDPSCQYLDDYTICGDGDSYCYGGDCVPNPCAGQANNTVCTINDEDGVCANEECYPWSVLCRNSTDGTPCGVNLDKVCRQGDCVDPATPSCQSLDDYTICGNDSYCYGGSCIPNPCAGQANNAACTIGGEDGICTNEECYPWSVLCQNSGDGTPCGVNLDKVCVSGGCVDPADR